MEELFCYGSEFDIRCDLLNILSLTSERKKVNKTEENQIGNKKKTLRKKQQQTNGRKQSKYNEKKKKKKE